MSQKLGPSREDRLYEVLLAFVEAREAGLEPDQSELLKAHPDLYDDLVAFFSSHDEVERLTAPLRDLGLQNKDGRSEYPLTNTLNAELGRLGDFQLIREVGRGGMGIVYEAEQL